jgi:hypothetical protein
MKIKKCPKCGSTSLGERWCKGRKLQQYCQGLDSYGDYDEDIQCTWVGEPYTPPKRRITNTMELRIDNFHGWHYLIYDKYGHLQTDSATHPTREEALKAMVRDLTPKQGYDDPAAPLTAVLFNVPSNVTITGTKYRFKKGGVNRV